ncbi:MAG TPA: hypothetical protein PK566_06100 [Pseudobacteroides sp.]|nr:hypothetical protein [Pseudobacteroides sp.]
MNIQGDKLNIIDLIKADTDFSMVNIIASNGINKNGVIICTAIPKGI